MIRRGLIALALPATLAVVVACGGPAEPPDQTPTPSSNSTTGSGSTPSSSLGATPPPGSSSPPSTPPPSAVSTPPPSTPPPPTAPPFPTAKDGQNYKACNDGNCEVLIRKHAVLTLNGEKNTATVKDGGVRLTSSSGYISLGGLGGYASWSNGNGPTHSASLKAAEGDTVIMVITTRR